MIPKKIHYVWVGGKEKPENIKRCMATWQNHLQDYEIIEWNESNFDIFSNPFAKAAYEAKKWAYVSDYIRAYVIYHEGGIYLDTDVLILDNFDDFLNHRAFVGYENENYPFTAVFGAEKGHPFLKKMLDYYDDHAFLFDKNDQLKTVNTKSVSDILIQDYHCQLGNLRQTLADGIEVYPDDILCNPSKKSVSIHVFTGTWMEGKKPLERKINTFLKLRVTTKHKAGLFRKYIMRKPERGE